MLIKFSVTMGGGILLEEEGVFRKMRVCVQENSLGWRFCRGLKVMEGFR